MPVIPRVGESQVLNPSSPVPIDSPQERRIQGESLEQFGRGVFTLGTTLSEIAAKQKKTKDTATMMNATNQFRYEMLRMQAEQAAGKPLSDDETGFGAVEKVRESADKRMFQIANSIQDEDIKANFLAQAGDIFNDKATQVLATEVKKRGEANDVLMSRSTSLAGQIAMQDPSELPFQMDQLESQILESPDLTEAEKSKRILESKRSVLKDGIQGFMGRKDYAGAKRVFSTYAGGIFTDKEKAATLDEIQATEYKNETREFQAIQRAETVGNKQREETNRKMKAQFYANLAVAGPNELKRGPIVEDINKAVEAGLLKPNEASSLIGDKVFSKIQDSVYESKILKEAFEKGNYQELSQKVMNDAGTQLSVENANKLSLKLGRKQSAEVQKPEIRTLRKSGEDLIKTMLKPSLTEPLSAADKQKQSQKVQQSIQEYYKSLIDNPDQDPSSLSQQILRKNFGASTTQVEGVNNSVAENTPQGIKDLKDKLMKEASSLRSQGKFTKDKNKEFTKRLQLLNTREEEIRIKQPEFINQTGGRPTNESK